MATWAELDKLAIAKPRADGRATLVASDDRPVDAIADGRALSTVMAIARVTRGRRVIDDRHAGRGVVVYGCRGAPPPFLVDAVTAAGGVVFDGAREHVAPKPLAVSVQLDAAFCDLATVVRRRLRVKSFDDALDVMEARVRRTKPAEPWVAILELVALAGELVRGTRFARWVVSPDQRLPFALDLGASGSGRLFPGQLAQAIVEGGAGSLRALVPLVAAPPVEPRRRSSGPAAAKPGRAMPMLCDRDAVPLDRIAWRPIVDAELDHPTMPIVAWVEDHGETVSWPPPEQGAALEPAALRNVDEVAVEITALEVPFATLALVTGDYFAAETLLSPATMERVRAVVGGDQTLLVGTPARGHMFAMSAARALVDDDVMTAFLGMLESEHLRASERDRISNQAIIYSTRPLGRVKSNLFEARELLRSAGVDPDA